MILFLLVLSFGCAEKEYSQKTISFQLPEKIDFNFHIRPILSDRCFTCHGPDEAAREANLRLDNPAFAFQELENGRKILSPSNLKNSEVWHRIHSDDPDIQMPPPESNLSLTDEEKKLITQWIEEGAEYKPHWAFIPPQKTKIPEIEKQELAQNEIDNFIISTLTKNDLFLSPKADKEQLIRRLSFDLTGLPPRLSEIDHFLADDSPEALGKVIDRLLATDAFAERMCMDWLDVARYADSHGLHSDGWRSMYPWRDWVIKAFQANMPFDQFLTWQLAGDLMDKPTEDQLVATAFNRNHKTTAEGGAVDEEYRMEYVHDRVATTATAFMGLTLECARCHDHKYDPISQKEYYQFAAFFNQVDELGLTGDDGNAGPNLLIPSSKNKEKLLSLQKAIQFKKQELELSEIEISEQIDFVAQLKKTNYSLEKEQEIHLRFDKINVEVIDNKKNATVSKEVEIVDSERGKVIELNQEYEFITVQNVGLFEQSQPFSGSIWVNPKGRRASQTIMGNSGPKGMFWRGWDLILDSLNRVSLRLIHALPHDVVQVYSLDSISSGEWTHLAFSYDGMGKAAGIKLYINGELAESKIKYDRLYRSIYPIKFNKSKRDLALRLGKSYRAFTGEYGIYEGLLDEFRLFSRELSELEIEELAEKKTVNHAIRDYNNPAKPLKSALFQIWKFRHHHKLETEISELRNQEIELLAASPEVMVMKEVPEPRATFVLNRGNYDQQGEEVIANTPSFLNSFPETAPQNRLGFAQWLTSPEHPLTSRVAVNRIWQMLFGRGLVDPPHDFGLQGNLPSHPELLDWLAVQFVKNGWDMKALIKLMVSSATYQQTSKTNLETRTKDPDNILLSRGPSHRLTGEMIRDNALASSGLLDKRIGGPSVKPIQPEGLWREKTSSTHILRAYFPDSSTSRYRRSMYTFVRRTSPHPAMRAFDAPNRSVCTVKRSLTNTPMQALVLLNDPQFIEASRHLAEKMLREKESLDDQISHSFRLLTGRIAKPEQVNELKTLFTEEKLRFAQNPKEAEKFISIGQYPASANLPKTDLAAMTLVINTLMNLDGFYTKR